MKNFLYLMRLSAAILIAMYLRVDANCQTLLIENFSYASGTLLTTNGWSAHSGAGNNPVAVGSPGLSYQGYPSSGIGLAALLTNDGEDVNRTFTSVTSGSVYCAFLMQANSVTSDYFLHLSNSGISSNRARIFIKGTGNSFNIGLSKGSETAVYTTGSPFTTGTTYLLVLKYSVIDGAANDIVNLYIVTSSIPPSEPLTPSVGPIVDAVQSDLSSISSVALRQYSASQNIIVDGIRVAARWEDAVGALTNNDARSVEVKPVLYPVPVTDELTIGNILDVKVIEIFDISGRKVLSVKTEATDIVRIPVSHIAPGLYILKLNNSRGVQVMRFVKN
jgi:hypothetical protein